MPNLQDVRAYLLATRWTLADDDSRTTLWHLAGRDEQIVLPARPDLSDSAEVIENALRTAAYVEHRQDVGGLVLPMRRPQRAEAYANQTRLSTQAGSFVPSLALPLYDALSADTTGPADDLDDNPLIARADLPRATPFGRRVTDRIAAAVQNAQELADSVNDGDRPLRAFVEPRPGQAQLAQARWSSKALTMIPAWNDGSASIWALRSIGRLFVRTATAYA